MTPQEQHEIERIEAERRRREAALLFLLLFTIGGAAPFQGRTRRNPRSARAAAMHAVNYGGDPLAAIAAVVNGNPEIHLPGIIDPLAVAMAEAYRVGHAKAFELAGEEVDEYVSVAARYRQAATDAAARLIQSISQKVAQVIDGARQAGLKTPAIAAAVSDLFTLIGWTVREPATVEPTSKASPGYAAVTMATDSILTPYGDGMYDAYFGHTLTAKGLILGHFSVMDGRTSDICIERDGLALPASDPYWRGNNWPQLHPRCRSVVMPRKPGTEPSDYYPVTTAVPGWGRPPGLAFGYRF